MSYQCPECSATWGIPDGRIVIEKCEECIQEGALEEAEMDELLPPGMEDRDYKGFNDEDEQDFDLDDDE